MTDTEFKTFQELLVKFFDKNFSNTKRLTEDILNKGNEDSLVYLLEEERDELYTLLNDGRGPDDYEYEISDLEDEVRSLEREVSNLRDEVDSIESDFGNSLNDDLKRETYMQHHQDYLPWEFEKLLRKGKKLLKKWK
jgi:predicted RNase H-like nuclease (RuvC/YqgF family)